MLEKLNALAGIAVICTLALGGLWLAADWFFDRLVDTADPGPPRLHDEIDWLSYTPDRTRVDIDDLHDDVLAVEAELSEIVDFLEPVSYSPIRDRNGVDDILVGAQGSATITDQADPDLLRAAGFVISWRTVNVPASTYPITGPPPTIQLLQARQDGIRVHTQVVEGTWWLTFEVRPKQ